MKYNPVFIDLDGTLTEISQRHYSVYTQCCRLFHAAPVSYDEYWKCKRNNVSWSVILKKNGIESEEKQFLEEFIKLIESKEQLQKDKLLPGTLEVLQDLRKHSKLTLVSLRRNREELLHQLSELGIKKIFTAVLSGHSETKEGTLNKKSEIIASWEEYENGVIIGDTEADIAAAKQLNIDSIATTTGIRNKEFLQNLNPTFIVDSIQQAYKLMK